MSCQQSAIVMLRECFIIPDITPAKTRGVLCFDGQGQESDGQISESDRQISESDRQISTFSQQTQESDRQISESDRQIRAQHRENQLLACDGMLIGGECFLGAFYETLS